MLVGKGVAAMILAAIMVGAALFGTCSAIVTVVTVFNPFSAAAFLSMAAAGFGIAYLMYRLIRNMYKSPLQRLDKPRPPQIDKKD
jgi:DNA-binding transcriptional LysR family regulator